MLSDLFIRLRSLFHRNAVESELEDEMQMHLERQVEKYVGVGMTQAAAMRRARLEFGGLDQVKQDCREARGVTLVESLIQDARYALRLFRKAPGFTIVAVLTLALGIGANTAIFSVMNAAMFKSLPVAEPERLVQLKHGDDYAFANALWHQIRAQQDVFSGVFAYQGHLFNSATGGQKHFVTGLYVSGDYFSTLGVSAAIGRTLAARDDQRGAPPVAVISYSYWRQKFAGDPDILNRRITLEKHAFQIVGVAAPGFYGTDAGYQFEVAVPLETERILEPQAPMLDAPLGWWLYVFGRLKPNVTLQQAQLRMRELSAPIDQAALPPETLHGQSDPHSYTIDTEAAAGGVRDLRQRYGSALIVLSAMIGVVLLIACANIANLQLARASARQHEFAIRAALGAARRRLLQQFLIESAMLSVAGSAIGIFAAQWGSRLLVAATASRQQTAFLDLSPDLRVLLFVLGTAVVTTLLFGMAPALQLANAMPQNALKQGSRVSGRRRWELTRVLVPIQVALSIVLLFGATLLIRSLGSLLTQQLGFQKDGVVLLNADLETLGRSGLQLDQLAQILQARLTAIPDVRSASRSAVTPISGQTWQWNVSAQSQTKSTVHAYFNLVSPGFLQTLGIPLIAGRDFDVHDTSTSSLVAIVSQQTAQKLFAGVNPIGRYYHDKSDPKKELTVQIVGVAGDAKYRRLRDPEPPTIYLPITQNPAPFPVVGVYELRYSGPAASILKQAEDVAASIDPQMSLEFTLLSDQVVDSLQQEHLLADLSAVFSILALVLACIGIYGVISYSTSRRINEIGVRMALGARQSDVLRMILRESLLLVGIGIAIGIPSAIAASQLIKSMLFQVRPADPITIALTIAIMAATAVIAAYKPAARASHADPMDALRCE